MTIVSSWVLLISSVLHVCEIARGEVVWRDGEWAEDKAAAPALAAQPTELVLKLVKMAAQGGAGTIEEPGKLVQGEGRGVAVAVGPAEALDADHGDDEGIRDRSVGHWGGHVDIGRRSYGSRSSPGRTPGAGAGAV